MPDYSLHSLFDPRAVAVVGASPDLTKPGGRCLAILRKFGYAGRVYAINSRYQAIGDIPCLPDLESLPEPIELVILLVPAKAVPDYLRASGRAGAKAAVICTSGFAEAGESGIALQHDLVDAAREFGIAVLGPNCLGMVDLHSGFAATFSTAFADDIATKAGPIAFISQSGAMGAAVFYLAQLEGIGFGKFLSTGNEAVQDFSDFLEHIAGDPNVSLILGYMEGIRDGRRFVSAARRAHAAGKHVGILKVGRSDAGRQAAQSHTGALVGSNQVFDAAFRRSGILPVADIRGLIDLGVVLPGRWPAQGNRVGIVSSSGGAGVMLTDKSAAAGLVVPALSSATRNALAKVLPPFVGMANPVDYGPVYGDPSAIRQCIDLTGADESVDMLLFFLGLSPAMSGIIEPILAEAQEKLRKPIIATWLGGPPKALARLRELGVPTFDDITRAVEAALQVARTARPLPVIEIAQTPATRARADETRSNLRHFIREGRDTLTEREVKTLLARYGIPVVEEAFASSAREAADAAERFGRPVAIKAEAPSLVHKSDAGAVKLAVHPSAAAQAYQDVTKAAARAVGSTGVRGAVVQPMVEPGVEILAGLRWDRQFGATVTLGLGGVTSEVLADVTTELAPVDRGLALEMITRLRGAALLGAFRGAAPRDTTALADMLVALAQFAVDAGELISELDLNPVMSHAEGCGCTVVDAAAVLGTDPTK